MTEKHLEHSREAPGTYFGALGTSLFFTLRLRSQPFWKKVIMFSVGNHVLSVVLARCGGHKSFGLACGLWALHPVG